MTLVTLKNRPVERNFNNAIDTFFNGFPSVFRDDFTGPVFKQSVPVNVKETESGYELELAAPGFEKESFKIDLDKNLLTISAEVKNESEVKSEKHLRREFSLKSFKRSFTIDEKIDAENIDAKYLNGVLVLNLPKKAEVKAAAKQITIQ